MIKSVLCSTLFLLLVISTQTFAAQPEVTITEIFVDNDNKQIVIMGENFDIGPDPTTVSFGGFGNLNITTNTSTLLVVDFPAEGLQEGIYPLAVSSGPGARKNDEAIITIGAQGPQGGMGSTGPAGPMGSTGPAGPMGSTGADGPQGDTGATEGLQDLKVSRDHKAPRAS